MSALALVLGVVFGTLLPARRREGFADERPSDEALDSFLDTTQAAHQASELDRLGRKYKCEMSASQGMPRCLLKFNESEGSIEQDVKCRVIQDAMSTGRGSYVKTGSFLMDEGRIRTNMDNLNQCDLLPTDTLLYPDGGQFAMCSTDNKNLYDESLGHGRIVDIQEAVDEGRCRITFKSTSKPDVLAYSTFLDERAREQNIVAARQRVDLTKAAKSRADDIAAPSFAKLSR